MMYRSDSFSSRTWRALAAIALVLSGAACSASADGLAPDCSLGACLPLVEDSGTKVDTGTTPPREAAPPPMDTGPSRNLLCGVSGCDPGNVSACGFPVVDGGGYDFPAGDADDTDATSSDGALAVSGSASDAQADAGTSAQTPTSSADGGLFGATGDGAAPDGAGYAHDANASDGQGGRANDGDGADEASPSAAPDASSDASLGPNADVSVVATADATSAADAGADEPRIVEACYLKPSSDGIMSACAPRGAAIEGTTCQDSSDCAALLACVEVDGQTACRPLRCELPPSCSPGTFYQEVPLRIAGVTHSEYLVPVCLPNDACTLLADINPCPNNEVCAIVGSKGETTCLVPGTHKQGDSCTDVERCAAGLVCSKFYNKCLKLCHADANTSECGAGACQGGNSSLPAGFGICVGETTDGG